MSVVAIDTDGATICLIELQTREYQFGVIGLICRFNISARQQQHRETRQQRKPDRDIHIVTLF
jgi:hypothetical protein